MNKVPSIRKIFPVLAAVLCVAALAGCSPGAGSARDGELEVYGVMFASGKEGANLEQTLFRRGENIWALLRARGFSVGTDREIWVEQDLRVTNPRGVVILTQPRIAELRGKPEKRLPYIPFYNRIRIPEGESVGIYTVDLVVRDCLALTSTKATSKFRLE